MSQFNSLSDYFPLLNQHIAREELLSEYLYQMEAKFEVALTSSYFLYHKKSTIQYYLSSINDIVISAKKLSEKQLNNLIVVESFLSKQKSPSGGETIH
jgi:hypothetical protein